MKRPFLFWGGSIKNTISHDEFISAPHRTGGPREILSMWGAETSSA
ncbi:hypothetical protein [Mucilaginibacter dorajii]|nr:hypothetical protein [Mucilaginibacter dorajii]MCS3736887.1 hypothetical protein [Mucilaginibacter dorajii]